MVGMSANDKHPVYLQHRRHRCEWPVRERHPRWRAAFAIDDVALGRAFALGVSVVWNEFQKTVLNLAFCVGCDKGSFALAAYQQVLGRQLINGLAHCALTYLKPSGEFHFTGNGGAGLPFTGLQTLQDQYLDLLVQWTECGRHLCRGC
jgi:hypothetical protein